MTTRTVYDRKLLDEILARDGATLTREYEKLTCDTIINFKCKCGNEHQKNFTVCFMNGGMFCKKCTKNNKKEKVKKTNLERFGVENAFQAKDIKDKIKKTNLIKYGAENPFASNQIKKLIKKTNLEKYGVEYTTQCKEVRDKAKKTNLEKYGFEVPSQCKEIKDKAKKTNLEKYGVDNAYKCKEFQDKAKKTNIEKYGVEYTSQCKEIQDKIKRSNIQKFGVEVPTQCKEIRDKTKKTNLERYGVEVPTQCKEIRDKAKKTNLERYGVEVPTQSKEIQDKIKATNIKKYGVERPTQNEEVFAKAQKNAKKFKDFTMPSGTIRQVQGYEPFALRDLLQTDIKEEEILTERQEVPRIKYSTGEKDRYYFPDIFIPHQNRLIEVKSTWTYKCKTDFVKQKGEAATAAGYNYELWIYDGKGKRVPQNVIIPPDNK